MKRTLTISVIALIAVVMVIGVVSPAMAKKDNNNGNNGCKNANPNAKACEKNPNTDPVICQDCLDKLYETVLACPAGDSQCVLDAGAVYQECITQVDPEIEICEVTPPPPR
ncbi:MAG: hypothetical protein OEL81_01435 [Nitrosopumilus sp.]|nr:hypothetical protein [Nitrosopumilus sp.]